MKPNNQTRAFSETLRRAAGPSETGPIRAKEMKRPDGGLKRGSALDGIYWQFCFLTPDRCNLWLAARRRRSSDRLEDVGFSV